MHQWEREDWYGNDDSKYRCHHRGSIRNILYSYKIEFRKDSYDSCDRAVCLYLRADHPRPYSTVELAEGPNKSSENRKPKCFGTGTFKACR